MTMELLILRHGEAGNRLSSVNKDFGRDLTVSGRTTMEEVANSINGLKFVIDKIATSPLPRAKESAEIVAKALNKERDLEVWDELKPEGQTADLYRRLSKLKGESSILLVGHEPYLSGLISELISGSKGGRIILKKSGMAKVVVVSLGTKPSGQLKWLLTPRQIKRMS
jgi:phosphohistidine phosphatase